MAVGETTFVGNFREQLLAGRARLTEVLDRQEGTEVLRLLEEVDTALHKIDHGTYGICEQCHGDINSHEIQENPLLRVCLDCLTPKQVRALEYDLQLAAEIQKGLLPPADLNIPGWEISYHYRPAGVVSGDYCDVIRDDGHLYFIMADVSGKGVAAAMLASNLRAIFRSLVPLQLPMEELMVRANRLFRDGALPNQYATLVFGRSSNRGALEWVNLGHLPLLLASSAGVIPFESTCRPLGLFADDKAHVMTARLSPGDTVVLYTDGICEAEDEAGNEFGVEALRAFLHERHLCCPTQLVQDCQKRLESFRGGRERLDDETLLAIQYTPAAAQSVATV